ncbi:NIPSNAP family protein [Ralstonia insidiosa]|nr:NIPSNAP family protein [Ralstonia insidiosa]
MNASIQDRQLEVIELRQYTLRPNKRDALIDLFDRELVEPQEAVGMTVLGQFRDLDHPDLFVWLRGFESMQTRLNGLKAFYGGVTWQAHAEAANATMLDSDNVLLLRPAWEGAHLPKDATPRASRDATAIPPGLVDITVFYLDAPASAELLTFCRERMTYVLNVGGACAQGWYITEPRENNFPDCPCGHTSMCWWGLPCFPTSHGSRHLAVRTCGRVRLLRSWRSGRSGRPRRTGCCQRRARPSMRRPSAVGSERP